MQKLLSAPIPIPLRPNKNTWPLQNHDFWRGNSIKALLFYQASLTAKQKELRQLLLQIQAKAVHPCAGLIRQHV